MLDVAPLRCNEKRLKTQQFATGVARRMLSGLGICRTWWALSGCPRSVRSPKPSFEPSFRSHIQCASLSLARLSSRPHPSLDLSHSPSPSHSTPHYLTLKKKNNTIFDYIIPAQHQFQNYVRMYLHICLLKNKIVSRIMLRCKNAVYWHTAVNNSLYFSDNGAVIAVFL